MELDWSEQSPHIRTLYHPWQPGDGYDEAEIEAAEAQLGLRLPTPLRKFYCAWGRRRDMTHRQNHLLGPAGVVRANTLIFCVENQVGAFWGIPYEALEETDPPVVVTPAGPSGWDAESKLNWTPSHAHLSGFLDDLTYDHAFAGGAVYGAETDWDVPRLPDHHIRWLEENWSKATVGPLFHDVDAPESLIYFNWPPLYIRNGQAFCQRFFDHDRGSCWLAAREAEALDEISQRFQIKWARRWQTGIWQTGRVSHLKWWSERQNTSM